MQTARHCTQVTSQLSELWHRQFQWEQCSVNEMMMKWWSPTCSHCYIACTNICSLKRKSTSGTSWPQNNWAQLWKTDCTRKVQTAQLLSHWSIHCKNAIHSAVAKTRIKWRTPHLGMFGMAGTHGWPTQLLEWLTLWDGIPYGSRVTHICKMPSKCYLTLNRWLTDGPHTVAYGSLAPYLRPSLAAFRIDAILGANAIVGASSSRKVFSGGAETKFLNNFDDTGLADLLCGLRDINKALFEWPQFIDIQKFSCEPTMGLI